MRYKNEYTVNNSLRVSVTEEFNIGDVVEIAEYGEEEIVGEIIGITNDYLAILSIAIILDEFDMRAEEKERVIELKDIEYIIHYE